MQPFEYRQSRWFGWLGFGRVMLPFDGVRDAYGDAMVAPRWYWFLRRVCLFSVIVWRRLDEQCGRLDWRTAWDVSDCAIRYSRRPQHVE